MGCGMVVSHKLQVTPMLREPSAEEKLSGKLHWRCQVAGRAERGHEWERNGAGGSDSGRSRGTGAFAGGFSAPLKGEHTPL